MARGIVDTEAMMAPDLQALKNAKTPADMPFDIKKLGHAVLKVSDLARSVDFYTNVMGFTKRSHSPNWSELTFGDATVALHVGGTGEQTKTGLGFVVSDIEAACREATGGGAKVLSGPEERRGEPIKLASLVDSEGNEFSLTQFVG